MLLTTAVEMLFLDFKFCGCNTKDDSNVVKKKTESDENKKERSQMMENQWGDLCEQQYKNDYNSGHGDTKKQK